MGKEMWYNLIMENWFDRHINKIILVGIIGGGVFFYWWYTGGIEIIIPEEMLIR